MKRTLLSLALAGYFTFGATAQIIKDPTEWAFSVKKKDARHYTVIIHATIKEPWHMYALRPGGDGTLIPTSIRLDEVAGIIKNGAVRETSKPIIQTMEGVDGKVNLYAGKADFAQDITGEAGKIITGVVEYQTCSDKMCLPPKKKIFSITLR